MVEFLGRSSDGKTFTLSIGGQQHSYTNDKEGKRQAILDGLNAIETVQVGQAVYLSSNEALQVVAAVLYLAGVQEATQYQTVSQVTEKACAHIGYVPEVELGPPAVPFSRRGAYRKQYPPVDSQWLLAELEQASTSSYTPRQELNGRTIWNKAAWEIYNQSWPTLSAEQQAQIQMQVEAIAMEAGWQVERVDQEAIYFRPLPVDVAEAKRRLAQYLSGCHGQPVPCQAVLNQAQWGAYNRTYYQETLSPALAVAVREILEAASYEPEPIEDEYRPRPVVIGSGMESDMTGVLAALQPVATRLGPALLLRDLLAAVKPLTGVTTISEWQAQQLVRTGAVVAALRKQGYQNELTWCQPYHFTPSLGDDRTHQVILKEVRVQHDPTKTLTLAKGLAVYTPAVTIDDVDNTLVYLEMVGPKQPSRPIGRPWLAAAKSTGLATSELFWTA
jgi:hypothetical protein